MKRYQKIYDRDGYRCIYCKQPLWEDFRIWHSAVEDHLYPQSKKHNGSNLETNIVPSCQLCNSLKGDFIPKPFADQEGVLIRKNGKVEVNADFRNEYIRLVTDEIEKQKTVREAEFNLERKRRGT
jgi:hypothetical protein